MSKLLKLWKVLAVGAVVAALGMMASCVETGDEPEVTDLTVTIQDGGTGSYGGGTYKAGDTVDIYAGEKSGKTFRIWTTADVDVTEEIDDEDAETWFVMPNRSVTLRAWWDDDVGPVKYTATVYDGSEQKTYTLEKGDTLDIEADFKVSGVEFVKWVALNADKKSKTSSVKFGDDTKDLTYFIMPDQDVFVGATYAYEEGGASVRFTWEATHNQDIFAIWVSKDDVEDWYNDVYRGIYLANVDPEDPNDIYNYVSDIPQNPGIDDEQLDGFYNRDISSSLNNKGKYWFVYGGDYTAVCTVIDPDYGDTTDIVANYKVDDEELYEYFFDVGFDVGLFLAGSEVPSDWVVLKQYDNQHERPELEKSKSKPALLKVLKKGNVTYYVLRRPRK